MQIFQVRLAKFTTTTSMHEVERGYEDGRQRLPCRRPLRPLQMVITQSSKKRRVMKRGDNALTMSSTPGEFYRLHMHGIQTLVSDQFVPEKIVSARFCQNQICQKQFVHEKFSAVDVCAGKFWPGKVCPGDVCAGKVCAEEVCPGDICPADICVSIIIALKKQQQSYKS